MDCYHHDGGLSGFCRLGGVSTQLDHKLVPYGIQSSGGGGVR